MSDRMPNGYRRPRGPLTYKQFDCWLNRFDGTREQVVRWRVLNANGSGVATLKSEAEAQEFIRKAAA